MYKSLVKKFLSDIFQKNNIAKIVKVLFKLFWVTLQVASSLFIFVKHFWTNHQRIASSITLQILSYIFQKLYPVPMQLCALVYLAYLLDYKNGIENT